MCTDCYTKAGSPTDWTPQTARFVDLVQNLYAIHPTGGPLHAVLDDWNLDGKIEPWYTGWSAEKLDELYYEGWPLSELDPAAPAVVEGLGVSTRALCDEIAGLLDAMTVVQRYSALAAWMDYSLTSSS